MAHRVIFKARRKRRLAVESLGDAARKGAVIRPGNGIGLSPWSNLIRQVAGFRKLPFVG